MKKPALFILCCLSFANLSAGTWTRVNDLNSLRVGFGCAVLTDGRVQVVTSFRNWSYEIFDPATGIWTQNSMPAMGGDAWHPPTMLLPNGKVLYVAPVDGSVLVYDPVSSTWTAGPVFGGFQERSDVTLLKNGKVLMAGADPISPHRDCALYDYRTGNVNLTGALNVEHSNRATEILLHTGEVLIVGGGTNKRGAEIYDPVAETWTSVPSTSYDRNGGGGIRLHPPWNKALLVGPFAGMTEVFDPVGRTWADAGLLVNSARALSAMVMLPSGKPIMIGGQLNQACEIYDPDTETWTLTDSMTCQRAHFSACILHTGKILAMAGFSVTSSDSVRTAEIFDASEPVWSNKPALVTERAAHTITQLPIIHTTNCSTNVLIAGGENSSGFLSSCELYNYMLEDIGATGPLNQARARHGANLLTDGTVLVSGGADSTGALSSCEFYEAEFGMWTATGDMGTARFNHTATLLSDGTVFATGGEDGSILPSCETYSSGTWTPANPMAIERTGHSCALLFDGRVLVIGGRTNSGITGACEIYVPSTGNWSGTASLTTPRSLHTTVLLQSGQVLVIGGNIGGGSPTALCEMYDPATGLWSPAPSLNVARYSHNSLVIYSGLVLTLGGYNGASQLSSCEIYDPCIPLACAGNWKMTAGLGIGRSIHGSCNIMESQPFVITIGGENSGVGFLKSIEEYDIGLGYRPEWQSTIDNYQPITQISDSMYMQGTLFRGVSEADGGNHCHIVSSDHPIVTLLRVGGGNWQSNGGGRVMYIPRSSSWSDTHTVVHTSSPAQGYYMLCSIVNGIPCKWYKECGPIGVEEGSNHQLSTGNGQLSVYPNPATQVSGVRFDLPALPDGREQAGVSGTNSSHLRPFTLKVYDLSGRLVKSLPFSAIGGSPPEADEPLAHASGGNQITWDCKDTHGTAVEPGIYFYRVNHGEYQSKGKFVILD